MKKEKTVRIQAIHYDLEGDLDKAIETLKTFKDENSHFSRLYLSWEYDGNGYNDEEEHSLLLMGAREETDAEVARRIEKEEQTRKKQEAYDRNMFESLKKKFEP